MRRHRQLHQPKLGTSLGQRACSNGGCQQEADGVEAVRVGRGRLDELEQLSQTLGAAATRAGVAEHGGLEARDEVVGEVRPDVGVTDAVAQLGCDGVAEGCSLHHCSAGIDGEDESG